jgi:2-methylisocitrate lyase-like PEP mutase family enzyme
MQEFNAQHAAFRALHTSDCFVIPNPWDIGTARYLQHLGFQALATTSAGFAFARGLPDGAVSLRDMLAHIAEIVSATDLPVNADFGTGFADDPDGVARNVKACVGTGVAGLSIEDATGDGSRPLYDLPLAIERIRAARAAIDDSGAPVLLTARAECYLVGHPQPFAESLHRLEAYSAAGAEVLYAPGVA